MDVHFGKFDLLCDRLEVAEVGALLRFSAPLRRTEDTLSGNFCRRTRKGRSPSSDAFSALFTKKNKLSKATQT